MFDDHLPRRHRSANRIRIGRRVNERVGRAELPQTMDVAVPDHRLAPPCRPAFGEAVEVHRRREHRVVLDRIEQIGVTIEKRPQAGRRGEVRMRGDDERLPPPMTLFESREILERVDLLGALREVEQ